MKKLDQKQKRIRTPQRLEDSDQVDCSPSPDTLLGGRNSELVNYPPMQHFTLSLRPQGNSKNTLHSQKGSKLQSSFNNHNIDLENVMLEKEKSVKKRSTQMQI